MSNNQDFILNNAIEVGKDTKVTLGTITSGTVDLSTGNYFAETLAADTTYVFSNPGDVQSFQLEVTGGAVGGDLSVIAYDTGNTYNFASQTTSCKETFVGKDGTKLYVLSTSPARTIFEYDLSTAYDVSTATYSSNSYVALETDSVNQGFFFKPDGTKFYVIGSGTDTVYQYSMSTAWDITSSSYDSKSFSVASQETTPEAVYFKPDGTSMYICGQTTDTIYQYTLSTAWDVSTASYASKSLSVASQMGQTGGLCSTEDGTSFFVTTSGAIYQYDLTTGWDLSTGSYSGTSYSLSSLSGTHLGGTISDSFRRIYSNDADQVWGHITQVDTAVTWPASVEWPAGAAPITPAAGETDVYTFVTDDTGTTYTGLHTADNLS